jgi:hypothetical protein
MKHFIFPGVIALSLVTGCGSDSDSTSSQTDDYSVSGVVADGYLENAKVCLDINDNLQCDDSEAYAITDSYGVYELTTSLDNINEYNLIVEAGSDTIDSDTGTYIENPFVLTAPVGTYEFISPITTMLQNIVDTDPGTSLEDAEDYLVSALNLNSTDELYEDYVDSSALEVLHSTAQVIAYLQGNLLVQFEASDAYSSNDKGAAVELSLMLIEDRLSTIVASIEDELGDGSDIDVESFSSVIASVTSFSALLDQYEFISSAETAVSPRDIYDAGIYKREFVVDVSEIEGVIDSGYAGIESTSLINSTDDEIYRIYCDTSWDFLSEEMTEEECVTREPSSSSFSSSYTNWKLTDDDQIVEATYNGYAYFSEWLDGSTRKDIFQYLYDDQVVAQMSKTSTVSAFQFDLTESNVRDYLSSIGSWDELELDYPGYAGVDIDEELLEFIDPDASFSEASYGFVIVAQDIEIENRIETDITVQDESYDEVSLDELSIDTIIDNNYLIVDMDFTLSSAESGNYDVYLNAAAGDTSGVATIVDLIKEWDVSTSQSYVSDVETIATISWTRETLYGRDAIVFDSDSLDGECEIEALVAVGDTLIFIEQETDYSDYEYSTIYFNDAAISDIDTAVTNAIDAYAEEIQID